MILNCCKVETTKEIDKANCITHSGTFHADEVFATAFLSLLLDKIVVCRTTKVPENIKENVIVYDVGLGELDHHQVGGNGKRENDVPYAACGLVWKKYGKEILKHINVKEENIDYIYEHVDKNIIQFIDSNDNGISPKFSVPIKYRYVHLSHLIAQFNPTWNEGENPDERFCEAVEMAKIIVKNAIKSEVAKYEAKARIEAAIEKSENHIMILDRYMPWKEYILDSESKKAPEVLFVVFPSNRQGYNIYAVPKEAGSFANRKTFPKAWSGLRDEELQKVTGVKTARFCHIALFIATADTKEDAIKLAKLAVENND